MRDTSLIIVCWTFDSEIMALTQRCINSIRQTADVEIILIDNNSAIGSEELMRLADIYVFNKDNKGYVKGLNQGIKLASYDNIVGAAPDYTATEGWLEACKKTFIDIPNCGIAIPHLSNDPVRGDYWEEGLLGGWFLITREILDKVGLLDERFFNCCSDSDYAWRLKKAGLGCIVTGYSTIHHVGHACLKKFDKHREYWLKDSEKFMDKWRDDPEVMEGIRSDTKNIRTS